MAIRRIPYDGIEYDAAIWQVMQDSIINAATNANRGVLPNPNNGSNDALEVTETSPQSSSVEVKLGAGFAEGVWFYNDDNPTQTVAITPNTDGSGFDRIDLIVARANETLKTVTFVAIAGTPAGSPVAPLPVRSGSIYDIILAEVTAQNLFTVIANADIDNSVKNSIPFWQPAQGGTGVEELPTLAEVLVGSGSGGYNLLTAGSNFERLVYDSTVANGIAQIDPRPTVFTSTNYGSGTNFPSGTALTFASTSDPAGNLAGTSSPDFNLDVGWYVLWCSLSLVEVAAAGGFFRIVLRNNTTTATVLQSFLAQITSLGENTALIQRELFQVTNSSDNYRFQTLNGGGTYRAGTAGGPLWHASIQRIL